MRGRIICDLAGHIPLLCNLRGLAGTQPPGWNNNEDAPSARLLPGLLEEALQGRLGLPNSHFLPLHFHPPPLSPDQGRAAGRAMPSGLALAPGEEGTSRPAHEAARSYFSCRCAGGGVGTWGMREWGAEKGTGEASALIPMIF